MNISNPEFMSEVLPKHSIKKISDINKLTEKTFTKRRAQKRLSPKSHTYGISRRLPCEWVNNTDESSSTTTTTSTTNNKPEKTPNNISRAKEQLAQN